MKDDKTLADASTEQENVTVSGNRKINEKIDKLGRFETFSVILMFFVGLILVVVPGDFPINISYFICAAVAVYGLCMIFRMNRKSKTHSNVFAGTAIIITAIVLAVKSNLMLLLLTLLGSILLFTSAVYKAGIVIGRRKMWCVILSSIIISVSMGILLIGAPLDGGGPDVIKFLGVLTIIEAVMDIGVLIILKYNFVPVDFIKVGNDQKKSALVRFAIRAAIILILTIAAVFTVRGIFVSYFNGAAINPDVVITDESPVTPITE